MSFRAVCVFCGSSAGSRAEFAHATRTFGREVAGRGLALVYGGGRLGLMGAVAQAALDAGGRVVGVIPEMLKQREAAHFGLSELHVVAGMHERKAMMAKLSDAFVALPGGFGTLDELCEVLTWNQLGIIDKPVGLLNVAGYFDGLVRFLDSAVDDGLLRPAARRLLLEDRDGTRLLDRLQAAARD